MRLTYWCPNEMGAGEWRVNQGGSEISGEAIDRLAAYENSGLEPEDYQQLAQKACNVAATKGLYQPGTRLVCLSMADPFHPIPPYTRGTVRLVDDMGQIHCSFDNGRSGLALVPGVDVFRALTAEELEAEGRSC